MRLAHLTRGQGVVIMRTMVLLVARWLFTPREFVRRLQGRQDVGRSRLLLAGAFAVAALVLMPSSALAAGAEAKFTQLNWLSDEGSVLVPNSDVGVVEFSFAEADTALLKENGGGYVNVVTNTGTGSVWSVENLYLSYPNLSYMLASHPTVQFSLGVANETPVNEIDYSTLVTSGPLSSPPSEELVSPVAHEEYLVGGFEGGGSGEANTYNEIGSYVGCKIAECAPPKLVALIPQPPANVIPAVAEDKEGCFPGGVARSLVYMFGKAQLNGITAAQVYTALKKAMGTTATGTTDPNGVAGKEKYVKEKKLPVKTTNDLANFKGGAKKAPKVLTDGGDVELGITWTKGGGHIAMVTSITELKDPQGKITGYKITYVDDPRQGNGQALNEEHVIQTNEAGKITAGGDGTVDGFVVEEKKK